MRPTPATVFVLRAAFVLLAALAAVLGIVPDGAARAGDEPAERTIGLPDEGLTLRLPAGWKVAQPDGKVLLLTGPADLPAEIRVKALPHPGLHAPGRVWGSTPGGPARLNGILLRDAVPVFRVEADLPKDDPALRARVEAILDTFDTLPYLHATRHVDWAEGWTIDLPLGFLRRERSATEVRFAPREGGGRIDVGRLDRMALEGGQTDVGILFDERWKSAWDSALAEATAPETPGGSPRAVVGSPVVETLSLPGVDGARRATVGLDPGPDGRPRARLGVVLLDWIRGVALAAPATGDDDPVLAALSTLRPGTDPGPLLGAEEAPGDRFPGEKGPPVAFRRPPGWTFEPGSNEMRLAQVRIEGVSDVEGIVFWFGAGMGGGVEQNLSRWRGQIQPHDQAKTEVVEVAAKVKAHLLDAKGAYLPGMGGGSPHGSPEGAPHGQPHPGFRMLAAVLEVPEGPLFVKFIGPEATIAGQEKAFREWVLSFRAR